MWFTKKKCDCKKKTIALGTNPHDTHFTLDPSDIPTARDQTELTRLFAAPSAYSIVSYDDYFAVKPAILATLLTCFGASMPNTGAGSNPGSDSGSRNDDESILGSSLSNSDLGSNPGTNSGSTNDAAADDDGGGELSQAGSSFRAC